MPLKKGKSKKVISANISELEKSKTKAGKGRVEEANLFGQEFAKKAKTKKISKVVFDRSGYRYHGRVKAFAEGARKGGMKF